MNLLIAIALMLSSLSIRAATYYVDFASGSDSNSGTSTGTPFKHCKGDANATGNAAAVTINAGDVFKFKGGVTYIGQITLASSGNSLSQVTYDGNDSSDWGAGKAIIDGNYVAQASCFVAALNVSYITIKGFQLQNCGGWSDSDPVVVNASNSNPIYTDTGGNGVAFYLGGHTGIIIKNLYIQRMGGWRNTAGWTDQTISGSGIYVRNCNGVTIDNCEITKTKTAIGIAVSTGTTQNVEVKNCNIHDYITWGVDVATQASGTTFSNISIHDTAIHDYQQFTQGVWSGYGEWPHTDGIFLRKANSASVWTNVRVYNCNFYCDNPGASQGGTASIFISQGPSALIYNNIFNQDSQTRGIGVEHPNVDSNQQTVRIYNNTFVMQSPAIISSVSVQSPVRQVYIQNNIFRSPAGATANNVMITRLDGQVPTTMDNDLFFDPGFAAASKYVAAFPAYTIQPNFFAWYSVEQNSVYGNPNQTSPLANPLSTRNFNLQSPSPAIGMGANLSAYFTTDRNGSARPAVGAWDVGAYMYAGANPPLPAAPTNLRLIP